MENGTNALKGALSDRKGKERKIEMEAKQRLNLIQGEIKQAKEMLWRDRDEKY